MRDPKTYDQGTNFRIARGLYLGALMSPAEVAHATSTRDDPVYNTLHRWTLCGDVSPALFELLRVMQRQGAANERVTAFSSQAGNSYVAISHQIGAFQHRFFLPLFDAKVAECLASITGEGRLGYSVAGENNEAIVWPSVLGSRDFIPVRAMCGNIPEGREEETLEEYARLLGEARDPARIPSVLEGVTVKYASVSAIAPSDVVARLARRYGMAA
jgi:hypothetical protein